MEWELLPGRTRVTSCDLCEEARITEWFHEDEDCWIAECEICSVPMVVWRNHDHRPPDEVKAVLHERLAMIVDAHFEFVTASTSTTTCATSPTTTTPTPARAAGSSATGSGARRRVARFAPMLAVGDPAPDLSLPDQHGARVRRRIAPGAAGARVLLSPGRHAGLHDAGLRPP